MYIALSITDEEYKKLNLDDNNSPNWEIAVKMFKFRISSQYLEAVDLLVKDYNNRNAKERRYGFSILAIDCLLIETLQSFREGLTDSKGKLKNMFVNFLMRRQNFKENFSKEDAEKFYKDIRCGILYQAEIMGETLL